jgi:integrase/recombinase XerD
VTRLLEATGVLKYKAALSIAYGAGLRASEVVHLKVSDIDSQRMVLRVEQGKGKNEIQIFYVFFGVGTWIGNKIDWLEA